MKEHAVDSSWIESIGHDPDSNTLRVRTRRGEEYDYEGVTSEKFDALRKADSVGAHFGKHIKPHHNFSKR